MHLLLDAAAHNTCILLAAKVNLTMQHASPVYEPVLACFCTASLNARLSSLVRGTESKLANSNTRLLQAMTHVVWCGVA